MKLDRNEFEKLHSGDSQAFERLYNEYKDRIYTYLKILCRNDDMANEIFGNTMLSAFNSIKKLKTGDNIYGWLLRIAKNRYNDYLRELYRDKKIKNSLKDNLKTSDEEGDPFDIVSNKDKIQLIDLAMKNIKNEYREIIKLKYFEEMSHEEIAGKIDKSIDASESLLQRAIVALRNELKKLSGFF